jgi:membrane-bound serine protease (ClpP class)
MRSKMKNLSLPCILALLFCQIIGLDAQTNEQIGEEIWVLTIDGVINPVASSYIRENIRSAENTDVECLILQMDTPGGLMSSMRDIIKEILNSEVPIAVYISPRGAQSASAGVFITVAAHFAAMAPGTNIGAAHPVNMGGGGSPFGGEKPDSADTKTMMEKVTNDAVAQIRSLAHQRGRNEQWLEDAVRKSVSVTENEAVKLKVVDYVAKNLDDYIAYLDGKVAKLPSGDKILATHEAKIINKPMGLHRKILDVISEPNIAYLLMILGFYGLFFEIRSPGAIFPGVLGGIFLILAFFAFQVLPINYAGLALIIVGIILFILEIKIVSYGMLTIGGLVSMILGSMMLFNVNEAPRALYSVSLAVIIPVVICTVLFFVVALAYVVKAHKNKPTTGREGITGETGVAATEINLTGTVKVHGEIWRARAIQPIPKDAQIIVKAVERMVLTVEEYKST